MFAYLAFKAFTGRYPDALISTQQKMPWEVDPTLGLPCLKTAANTFEAEHGVYAAAPEEAQRDAENHRGNVYLVAPLPGTHAIVGDVGWRAEAAVCLGRLTMDNAPRVAELVLAAHAQGLPQVRKVLRWSVEYLIRPAWYATHNRDLILRALTDLKQADLLCLAGVSCEDDDCAQVIARALAETGDAEYLYFAGSHWPAKRLGRILAQALAETGDALHLCFAGSDWPDDRFSEAIVHALVKTRHAYYLYLAGCNWPERRFSEAITKALIETGNAKYLYLAGRDWPDGRFSKDIARALAQTRNAKYLYLAGRHWPKQRLGTVVIPQRLADLLA